MNYNMMSELMSLGFNEEISKRLYHYLKDVVTKPGKIKVKSEQNRIILTYEDDTFEVTLYFPNPTDEIVYSGHIKRKDEKFYCYFSQNGYNIRYVNEGEKIGIYEIKPIVIDDKKMAEVNYFDADTLAFTKTVPDSIDLYSPNTFTDSLNRFGIEPDVREYIDNPTQYGYVTNGNALMEVLTSARFNKADGPSPKM